LSRTVNFAVIQHDMYTNLYTELENGFNEYSKNNDLDITLKITPFIENNMTLGREGYNSQIDILVQAGSTEFDLYIFDPVHLKQYSTHFADLGLLLSKEHFDMYSSNNINQICKYHDQWVGLVCNNKYIY